MQLLINLPSREETIALVRSRWDEAVREPAWINIEGKFESNSFGQIIVTPPPPLPHSSRSTQIAFILQQKLGGRALVECPVLTVDGVKVPDAVWCSVERYAAQRGEVAFSTTPEICVEVLSPRNTDAEMAHKRFLYFDAGAKECWACDLEGRMSYYHASESNEQTTKSELCPDFPAVIED